MIDYHIGKWGIWFVFQLRGSVFPQAFWVSIVNAVVTGVLHYCLREFGMEDNIQRSDDANLTYLWSAFTWVLGILIIFRTQQAYNRFWEGGALLQQVRGDWINAVSSLFAFASQDPAKAEQVQAMQHHIVRLMSMLYCYALQQVAVMKDEHFDIIDNAGIDKRCLHYLESKEDKPAIVLQWVQRIVHEGMESGLTTAAPPIMARVFQDLARGMATVQSARRMAEFVFPFPYAQMISVMLMLQWVIIPAIALVIVDSWWAAACLSFMCVFTFWSINFIAMELEMPYGDDANDLPIAALMKDFNYTLRTLLEEDTQCPPKFTFCAGHRKCAIRPCTPEITRINAIRCNREMSPEVEPSDGLHKAGAACTVVTASRMLEIAGQDASNRAVAIDVPAAKRDPPLRQVAGDPVYHNFHAPCEVTELDIPHTTFAPPVAAVFVNNAHGRFGQHQGIHGDRNRLDVRAQGQWIEEEFCYSRSSRRGFSPRRGRSPRGRAAPCDKPPLLYTPVTGLSGGLTCLSPTGSLPLHSAERPRPQILLPVAIDLPGAPQGLCPTVQPETPNDAGDVVRVGEVEESS